jgi:hypothetical protein
MDQGCGRLFGGTARALVLDGMPLLVADGQMVQQPFGQILRSFRPSVPRSGGSRGGRLIGKVLHWTEEASPPILNQTFPPPAMGTTSAARRRRPRRGSGVLHPMAAILNLAGRRLPAEEAGAPMRRRRQRLALVQRLLDPLPAALQPLDGPSERFWRIVRWGGLGVLLAWILRR